MQGLQSQESKKKKERGTLTNEPANYDLDEMTSAIIASKGNALCLHCQKYSIIVITLLLFELHFFKKELY